MPPKKLSRGDKERLKKKLLQRKTYLIGEINSRISQASSSSDSRLTDLMDIAADSFDDEMAMSLASQEREEIVAIDDALAQIKDGNYGVCTSCNRSISSKRLEVVPFSILCISCKRKQEEGGDHLDGEE